MSRLRDAITVVIVLVLVWWLCVAALRVAHGADEWDAYTEYRALVSGTYDALDAIAPDDHELREKSAVIIADGIDALDALPASDCFAGHYVFERTAMLLLLDFYAFDTADAVGEQSWLLAALLRQNVPPVAC